MFSSRCETWQQQPRVRQRRSGNSVAKPSRIASRLRSEESRMKKFFAALALSAFTLAAIGCNQSPEGGSPGTENSFKLTGGTIPPTIKQGDAESIKVTVERGKQFQNSVRLEAKAPEKIHVSVDRNLVKAADSPEVNVRVHPAEEAPPGDYKVTVTGTTDSGTPTNLELTVRVVK